MEQVKGSEKRWMGKKVMEKIWDDEVFIYISRSPKEYFFSVRLLVTAGKETCAFLVTVMINKKVIDRGRSEKDNGKSKTGRMDEKKKRT